MLLATKMLHGIAREIAERVSFLRHECPYQYQPAKRVALRSFSELVLGTINKLIARSSCRMTTWRKRPSR